MDLVHLVAITWYAISTNDYTVDVGEFALYFLGCNVRHNFFSFNGVKNFLEVHGLFINSLYKCIELHTCHVIHIGKFFLVLYLFVTCELHAMQ